MDTLISTVTLDRCKQWANFWWMVVGGCIDIKGCCSLLYNGSSHIMKIIYLQNSLA